jgi:hypothetical protein
MRNLRRVIFAMFFGLSLTALAWAQEDAPEKGDPPGRAVRLQYMSGSVSIQPAGNGDWVEGALNRPLTNSDNIWSDKESRAELNVGTGILRMGDETSVTLTNVADNSVQVELHQGTLNLHVRRLFEGEVYEIDTPNLAFTVQKSGDYRFDVDPNGDATVVTVRKGEGDATGQGPGVRVHSDEQVRFTNETSLNHEVAEAPAYDGFDSWCAVRDKRLDTSLSARYVAPGTVGYEDLDDNGVWTEEPPYGWVWRPARVAPGWAPYQFGHWVWVSPWGWTWVDDASWGYAPFHYGRWVYASGYWGWAPGPVYVRPFYAPALVAWFGGPSWGVSLGFGVGGGYGWCPLGWGEPFYPWYGGSRYYFRNVNIRNTRIANINNYYGHPPNRFHDGHYANLRSPGGFTAVPGRTLANGAPVRGTAIRVSARQLSNAPMGRVNVAPTRNAMLGPGAGRRAAVPPARSGMRPTVSRASASAGFGRGGNQAGGFNSQKPFAGRSGAGAPSRVTANGPGRGSSPAVASNNPRNVPSPMARNLPRPASGDAGPARTMPSQSMRNVPRPPDGGMASRPAAGNMGGRQQIGGQSQARGTFSPAPAQRSVPRPPANFGSRASQPMQQRSDAGSVTQPSRSRPTTAVPRPTGSVRPASDYSRMSNNSNGGSSRPNYSAPNRGGYGASSRQPSNSPSDRGGYSAPARQPSYSSPDRGGYNTRRYNSPSYSTPRSASPQYSAPRSAAPQYSAPRYGGSQSYGSSPSYRSSGPSYSAPSYRGGGSSMGGSAPSYRSAPSYGGGGGGSRGGGGGGGSYHGGGGGGGSRGSSSGGHGGRR